MVIYFHCCNYEKGPPGWLLDAFGRSGYHPAMVPLLQMNPQNQNRSDILSRETGLHPALVQVMINRGFDSPEKIQAFLNPDLRGMADPFEIPDLEAAAERLAEAVLSGRKIGLFGDYDADGVTSTSVFVNFFKALGREVEWWVPNRLSEGYGLSQSGLEYLAQKGVELLVTADCGSSDLELLELAGRMGLEVIVTDHHKLAPQRPEGLLFVNPQREDCSPAFKALAGVGVVFFLLAGVRAKLRERGFFGALPEPNLKAYLDMVALGTLADVVPVTGQNRIILKAGLELLAQPARVGLEALAGVAKSSRPLTSRDVAFDLAPRINAPGRLGRAGLGVDLLTCTEADQAAKLAREMDRLNRERKRVEAEVLSQALAQVEAKGDPRNQLALVAAHEEWHLGVLGIVAARLSQLFYRPCFILKIEGDTATGSGRSIDRYHLHKGLEALSGMLLRYGGHSQAAGLTLKAENLNKFSAALEGEVGRTLGQPDLVPSLTMDADLPLDELDDGFVAQVERLSPFGTGNPEPVFGAGRVGPVSVRRVGKNGAHLKLNLRQGRRTWPAIAFNQGHLASGLGGAVRIAYRPVRDNFKGRSRISLHLKAIVPDR